MFFFVLRHFTVIISFDCTCSNCVCVCVCVCVYVRMYSVLCMRVVNIIFCCNCIRVSILVCMLYNIALLL